MFSLEMNSKNELYVSGCKGILAYSDNSITLDIGGFTLKVSGENISMLSYTNGEMYIDGSIESIEFEQKSEANANEKKH